MTHTRRLTAVALAMALVFVGWGRIGSAADFNFRETDIQQILAFIGRLGDFNVVVDPKVRQKMTFTVRNVDPEQAMYLVANLSNLNVKRVKEIPGKKTFVVAPRDVINKFFEFAKTRPMRLRYAKAEEVAGIVAKGLGKDIDLGVERDVRTNSLILRGPEDVINRVKELVDELDLPVPQVLIDAKIVTVETAVARELGFLWNWGTKGQADGNVNAKNAGSGPLFAITEFQRLQNNSSFFDQPGPSKGSPFFSFGDFFRGNYFFNSSFTAFESHGITRTLASPRLLAINGTQAQLRIGDKIVFSGGPSQPPEERDTGTVMDITPRINKDNFITMDINVDQSTARFDRGDFPTITRTNAKTTVQVKDGEEVMVGGLVQERSNPVTVKVPFLGDVPFLKHFFTRRSRPNTSTELVILLTPRVIKHPAPTPGEVALGAPREGTPEVQDIFEGSKAPPGTLPDTGTPPVPGPAPGGASPGPAPTASPGGPGLEFPDLE